MLTSVRLDNFKRFRRLEVPLGALTLFMGMNGAGKSSVIQSMLLVRQSLSSRSLDNGKISLTGDLCNLGSGRDVFNSNAGSNDKLTFAFGQGDGELAVERVIECDYSDSDQLEANIGDPALSLGPLEAAEFIYISAERQGPRLTSPRVLAQAQRGNIGLSGEGALAVLEHNQDLILEEGDPRALENAPSRSIYEQTQMYLAEITPGVRIDITPNGRLDSISAGFSFSNQGSLRTEPFRPTNVGFGLSYTLPIIVACLTARPGTLLLIENPEAHLHTKGQRAIADLLQKTASAGVQVIVETHSREVFYHLRNKSARGEHEGGVTKVNYFLSDDDGTVCTLSRVDGDLQDWPDEFFDAMGSPGDLIRPVDAPVVAVG